MTLDLLAITYIKCEGSQARAFLDQYNQYLRDQTFDLFDDAIKQVIGNVKVGEIGVTTGYFDYLAIFHTDGAGIASRFCLDILRQRSQDKSTTFFRKNGNKFNIEEPLGKLVKDTQTSLAVIDQAPT